MAIMLKDVFSLAGRAVKFPFYSNRITTASHRPTRSKSVMGLIVGVALGMAVTSSGLAATVVVPSVNENSFGLSNGGFPFGLGVMRYQQVFAASQFGGVSGFIDKFAYRPDEGVGQAFAPMDVNCQIWFSTTQKNPQGLDLVFDNNQGADKTLVFSGNMRISSAGNPYLFDVVFDVNNNFFYNGRDNLLMEVKVFAPAYGMSQLDSVATTPLGDGGTPWTSRLYAFGTDAPSGSTVGDDGMVTQFTFIPEPQIATLLVVGVGSCVLLRRRLCAT